MLGETGLNAGRKHGRKTVVVVSVALMVGGEKLSLITATPSPFWLVSSISSRTHGTRQMRGPVNQVNWSAMSTVYMWHP